MTNNTCYSPGLVYKCRLCGEYYKVGPESRECPDWKDHPQGRVFDCDGELVCCHYQDRIFEVNGRMSRMIAKQAPTL